ncbi:hypothetical protein I9W82_000978 [Candida metapsilosis]|uniref:Uncharacterized protein n=1 Tax=Candida metapsilosis TaxID=273372 RepID=A0A8H7ZHI0_9ASCO|nr:hypothetical protein I9W82_000978 [Candida metapsilosis]
MPTRTTTLTSPNITLENSLDYLLDQSWDKFNGNRATISAKEIPDLISEMETILGIGYLLTQIVEASIKPFISQDPDSRFSKSDVKKIITFMISPKSFASVLRDEAGLSDESVRSRIMNNSRTSKNDTFHIWKKHQNIAEMKAKSVKDEEIEQLNKEIAHLKQANDQKELKLKISEREINRLNTRVEDLANVYKDRGAGERTLVAQLDDKNAALIESTHLCKKYKDACAEYKQREKETALAVKTLEKEINRQNEVIQFLQKQLPVDNESSSTKDFLKNLPIVKQCFIFLKYRHDLKDTRVLIMSVIGMIFFFSFMVNLVQVVYLILSATSFDKNSGIIFNEDVIRSRGVLDLLSVVPAIEKFVYEYIDW